jgi:hypothetical protein
VKRSLSPTNGIAHATAFAFLAILEDSSVHRDSLGLNERRRVHFRERVVANSRAQA